MTLREPPQSVSRLRVWGLHLWNKPQLDQHKFLTQEAAGPAMWSWWDTRISLAGKRSVTLFRLKCCEACAHIHYRVLWWSKFSHGVMYWLAHLVDLTRLDLDWDWQTSWPATASDGGQRSANVETTIHRWSSHHIPLDRKCDEVSNKVTHPILLGEGYSELKV
jgi:hypothetical protein